MIIKFKSSRNLCPWEKSAGTQTRHPSALSQKTALLLRRKVADATKVWHPSKPRQKNLYPLNNNSSLFEVNVFIQMTKRANIKCPISGLLNHRSRKEIESSTCHNLSLSAVNKFSQNNAFQMEWLSKITFILTSFWIPNFLEKRAFWKTIIHIQSALRQGLKRCCVWDSLERRYMRKCKLGPSRLILWLILPLKGDAFCDETSDKMN